MRMCGGSNDTGHAQDTVSAFSAPPRPTVTTLTGKGNRFSTSSNAIVSARVAIWPPPAILPREPVPGTGLVGAGRRRGREAHRVRGHVLRRPFKVGATSITRSRVLASTPSAQTEGACAARVPEEFGARQRCPHFGRRRGATPSVEGDRIQALRVASCAIILYSGRMAAATDEGDGARPQLSTLFLPGWNGGHRAAGRGEAPDTAGHRARRSPEGAKGSVRAPWVAKVAAR